MQASQSEPDYVPVAANPNWRTRLPFFYGWVVVGSVFSVLFVTFGLYYSFSLLFVALLEEYGWTRAATAGVFSTQVLMMGLVGIPAGRLIDRYGPARVVPVGALLVFVGLLATSRLTELWQLYISYGVICGAGISLAGWVPAVTVISNWFSAKRGLATGMASAGSGLGTVAFAPLVQYMISSYGWRTTYLVVGIAAVLIIVPQTIVLQIGRPEKIGLRPDGARDGAGGPAASPSGIAIVDSKWASRPWTVASAIRTRRFWLLAGTIILVTCSNQTIWTHQAVYLVDGGYDKMFAASTVGLAALFSIPPKVLWGIAGDRFGREAAFAAGMLCILLALLFLILAGGNSSMPLVVLFAAFFAAGYAANGPITPSAAADIFAGRSFGSIYGLLGLATGIGGATGAWFAGYVFDVTGSYMVAFAMVGIFAILAAGGLYLAAPRKVRRVVRG